MSSQRTLRTGSLVVGLSLALVSCGNSNGVNGPSGSTCTSVGPLGSAKGQITATIGTAAFTGGVPTGASIYTAVAAQPALGLPAQDFVVFTGTCGDLTSLQITARATFGTTTIGVDPSGNALRDPQTQQPLVHSAILQLRANGAAAGTWTTNSLGGTGFITMSTVSTAGATGSFSFTMVPQAGTPAAGSQTVAGQFSVTF